MVALGGVGDADARDGGELDARAVAFKPKAIGENEVFAVERAVDLEKLRQSSGAFPLPSIFASLLLRGIDSLSPAPYQLPPFDLAQFIWHKKRDYPMLVVP